MTPKEIDIPTLQWVVDELKRDRANYSKWKTRNEAFISAMDEVVNTFECVILRVQRGEGLHPTSELMSATDILTKKLGRMTVQKRGKDRRKKKK